jgi:hypothetical protein
MTTLETFKDLISVKISDYDTCVDVLEHDFLLADVTGNLRFHHLKIDGNGRPMVKALAEMLYDYIITYCIASKNRPELLTPQQSTRLTKEARKLFRHPNIDDGSDDNTGEAGEALLFFLTEAILQAPQIVAKMELKTNHSDEVKGSDGIHAKWNQDDCVVDFYFGESKLYKSFSSAMASALTSISTFHDNEMYKHEFSIVTKHFKYADQKVKDEILNLIRGGEPGEKARINHACLIGYDWDQYAKLDKKNLKSLVKDQLKIDGEKIVARINKAFSSFEKKHLRFEIFLLPFPSVAEFRKAFNSALD